MFQANSSSNANDEDLSLHPDRVADFYRDKVLFISGGTGFMGKVLVEKLLRSCPAIKKMYLLIRTKKGKGADERLREIFQGPLFDMLKKTHGEEILSKVEGISGDVTEQELGISEVDRSKIAKEVNVIFHCAATIRFDEELKKAVLLNVRGTKFMLDLAKECQVLMTFCHVSTSYCHLHERILYEKAYAPPADPHNMIRACEFLSDDVINSISDKLLGDNPNSYAFTKAMGEALAVEQIGQLPIVILRPSVVIPIWREPLPGWTDNINGPMGLLIGAGKGVIRTMYCKGDSYADYLPVDIAVNALILSSYDNIKYNERKIYNCTSSAEYKVSWEEIIDMGRKVIETKMPLNGVVWYPGGSMKKSKTIHYVCFFLFQLIPALFIDGLLILLGYKPVLLKVQKRIFKGYEVFEYYANRQWDFNNDASMEARKLLNPREKETWKVDGEGINYEDYFTNCTHAARLYILKETDDTIPGAKRHMKVMWCVDKICKILLFLAFVYYLFKKLIAPTLGF